MLVASVTFNHPRQGERGILALWDEGRLVWSEDLLRGGEPYLTGEAKDIETSELVDEILSCLGGSLPVEAHHRGPDAPWIRILLYRDERVVADLGSWHEPFEESGVLVATAKGVVESSERTKDDIMAEQPVEYRRFRRCWRLARERLAALIPDRGRALNRAEASALPW